MNQPPRSGTPVSKTLSRGIQILETLAAAPEPLTIEETARRMQIHRSNAYRLLRTLENHGLVNRDAHGRFAPGARLAALAAGVASDLQAEALPELTAAANELGLTCFLGILDHHECVTLASVMPRHTVALVARRPGTRHTVTVGAPGKALLMQLPRSDWPATASAALQAEIVEDGRRGFASSHDEVVAGLYSVAVPLALRGRAPATLGAVYVSTPLAVEQLAARLHAAATAIATALGH